MEETSVAAIIPAFNVVRCVGAAIESALAQSLQPAQIIVVDDCSTDGTSDLVAKMAEQHPAIVLVKKQKNGGVAAARNAGIDLATTNWIAILDADDTFLPNRLEYLVGNAERMGLDLAADNYYNFDSQANDVVGLALPISMIGDSLLLDRYSFVRNCMTNMAGAVDLGLIKPIIRREFLVNNGLHYRENIRHGEDFHFYLDALMHGAKLALFPEAHYMYTQRLGSLSGKQSVLSRTKTDLFSIERDSRNLADLAFAQNDPDLAKLLLLRANKMKTARQFFRFRDLCTDGQFLKAAKLILTDRDAQVGVKASVQHKLRKIWN